MDPLSLSMIGGQTLTLGIQFLYAQAGEVLKRWRERRDGDEPEAAVATAEVGTAGLQQKPEDLTVDFAALEHLGPEILKAQAALAEYAEGISAVGTDNANLVRVTDALRSALEKVLGQDLTLEGEKRPEGGADIGVKLSVDDVVGYVAGVLADGTVDGRIRVDINAGRVSGRLVGTDLTGGED